MVFTGKIMKILETIEEKIENNTVLQAIAGLSVLAYFVIRWVCELIIGIFRK